MITIVKATNDDFQLLAGVARQTFIESHGHSGPAEDIHNYIQEKFREEACREELNDPNNIYHFIYYDQQLAGYSKIIFDAVHPAILSKKVTKLERLYLLANFYSLKLGYDLIQFNIELSKKSGQEGMWLYVWKENERAFRFYTKAGFTIIGSYDFKISPTHANPNYHLLLIY